MLAVLAQPDCTPAPPRGNALFLDGIADPGNLGTIVRTANGAGYADVYLRNCADPFAPKCVRAAMSGIFFVRLHIGYDGELFGALGGVPFVCADMAGEDMFSFSPPRPFCLVIGSEANGVSEEVQRGTLQTITKLGVSILLVFIMITLSLHENSYATSILIGTFSVSP